MAYAALARMRVGRPATDETIPSIEGVTAAKAAEKAGVSVKTVQHAMAVDRKGPPELIDAVKSGQIAVGAHAIKIDTFKIEHIFTCCTVLIAHHH